MNIKNKKNPLLAIFSPREDTQLIFYRTICVHVHQRRANQTDYAADNIDSAALPSPIHADSLSFFSIDYLINGKEFEKK